MSTQTQVTPNGKQPATPSASPPRAHPMYALAAKYDIEPARLLEVLRGTVIKPDKKTGRAATNEEVVAFCIVANQYGLNPFTREIHAFASGDKGIVPMVGVDGWAKLVNSQPQFDGCDFEEVSADNGKPISVTCRMHVKGRTHPICVTERFVECVRSTGPWGQMPWRMLRHKAFMQAARYAFSLSGLFDEDEANDIVQGSATVRPAVQMPRAIGEMPALIEPPNQPEANTEHEDEATGEPAQSGTAPDSQQSPEGQAGSPQGQVDEQILAEWTDSIAEAVEFDALDRLDRELADRKQGLDGATYAAIAVLLANKRKLLTEARPGRAKQRAAGN